MGWILDWDLANTEMSADFYAGTVRQSVKDEAHQSLSCTNLQIELHV